MLSIVRNDSLKRQADVLAGLQHQIGFLNGETHMSKVAKVLELAEQELAFEMIELACGGVDSLTRAFDMISDLCTELQNDIVLSDVMPSKFEIN